MTADLRLVRYFVAVAEEENVTRAAGRLHISQPSLSAAIKQLETQLGVELLERRGRNVALTGAGRLLLLRGRELLDHAEQVVEEVRAKDASTGGSLRLGLTPTARYEVAPELLAACAAQAPEVMLYTREDTTGALLRDVADGRLDLAVTFCAPQPPPPGIDLVPLRAEPAVVHMAAGHRLASREEVTLEDLVEEQVLIAGSSDSGGFTDRVIGAFRDRGITPLTRRDPYPDLGLRAVREGLGVVVYTRSAFPAEMEGSAFVRLDPPLELPFELAFRRDGRSAAMRRVVAVATDAD